MAYKKIIKVSDVCQLLDKSKLPNTQTVNGITYTVDKVNGTITANGTATAESDYKADIALNNAESYTNGGGTKIPSRLLFLGCPIGGSQTTYGLYNNWVSSGVVDTGNGGITDTTSDKYYEYYRFNLRITIKQGYTANNLIFKPQLFDLTEMYGAGHEPTTVEEFRQDFPEEMYDYSPHCWATSYSRRLKVSNVCQLLDKSKYPATTTKEGITWTNNGDGTITANGTATAFTNILVDVVTPTIIKSGHKFLMLGCPLSNGNITTSKEYWMQEGYEFASDHGNGNIFTIQGNKINLRIYIQKDYTANNLTFKPQIFDLTEMYGAGHEPTTVEQFRADFPNELYDYKPYSILPSYQRNLTCKTKNLFDYKTSAEKTQTNNGITLILNADYFELSGQQQAGKYIELGQSGFNIPFEIGKTYVLSADTIVKSGCKVFMGARYTDGENPLGEWETVSWNLSNGTIAKRFTPTRPGYFDKITFYNASDTIPISGDYIIRIQLEQGSTATDYVPYGHL